MKNKKKITVLLVAVIVFGLCFGLISAASKYYEYRWTNNVITISGNDGFITNDIIQIDDGYVAAGFYDGYLPVIRFLDESGKTEKEVAIEDTEDSMTKRIFEVEGGYIAVGIRGTNFTATYLKDDKETYMSNSYYSNAFGWEEEIYFEEEDDYIYVISDKYEDSVIRIHKAVGSSVVFDEIYSEDFTDDMWAMVENYTDIWNYQSYRSGDYYPTFVTDYDGGYVYGLNDFNTKKALVIYVKNGKQQWLKTLSNTFVRDGIQFGPNFIFTMNDEYPAVEDSLDETTDEEEEEEELPYSSWLQMYDKDGNDLGKDEIVNYLTEAETYFYPEHLINVNQIGFAMTGTAYGEDTSSSTDDLSMGGIASKNNKENPPAKPDGEEPPAKPDGEEPPEKPDGEEPPEKPADGEERPNKPEGDNNATMGMALVGELEYTYTAEILYFSIIHKVETKTDGNGTIEATKVNANWGDEVKFTVTPNSGFVLSEVKVTDSEGNIVIFTDNTFTMPNADVLIEASFKVENPETVAFISILVFVVLALSGTMLYKNRKKPTKYEEVK